MKKIRILLLSQKNEISFFIAFFLEFLDHFSAFYKNRRAAKCQECFLHTYRFLIRVHENWEPWDQFKTWTWVLAAFFVYHKHNQFFKQCGKSSDEVHIKNWMAINDWKISKLQALFWIWSRIKYIIIMRGHLLRKNQSVQRTNWKMLSLSKN